jgi:hypothetical protein
MVKVVRGTEVTTVLNAGTVVKDHEVLVDRV